MTLDPNPRAQQSEEVAGATHETSESPRVGRANQPEAEGHVVNLRTLRAFYGDSEAVKGIDLEFAPNKVTAMIGPSRCGKSTLVPCIARTIAVEPEVIIMDEPCSALDPIATLRIEELIGELKKRYTIILVTHNMQQAGRVADSTAFMLSGELVEVAETEKIFTNPDDERTEDYVSGKFG